MAKEAQSGCYKAFCQVCSSEHDRSSQL
ncbi:hypothetical protein A2U01_0108330, partial [Trifolium medium]|nr:hypothetical protein [Trifolium medium]